MVRNNNNNNEVYRRNRKHLKPAKAHFKGQDEIELDPVPVESIEPPPQLTNNKCEVRSDPRQTPPTPAVPENLTTTHSGRLVKHPVKYIDYLLSKWC